MIIGFSSPERTNSSKKRETKEKKCDAARAQVEANHQKDVTKHISKNPRPVVRRRPPRLKKKGYVYLAKLNHHSLPNQDRIITEEGGKISKKPARKGERPAAAEARGKKGRSQLNLYHGVDSAQKKEEPKG